MRKRLSARVVGFAVALGLAGTFAWAADAVFVDIPFDFIVRDQEAPAGNYEIRPVGHDMRELLVRGKSGAGSVMVQVIERLADIGGKEVRVVFDKVEGKYYLSEVHIPGMDGFLVGIAKGKESHRVLTGKEQKQP